MEAESVGQLAQILVAIEQLDDAELHALIGRAQGLLLDRPAPRHQSPELAVEVVERDEGRLLMVFRSLAPLDQRRLLGYATHFLATSQRLVRRRAQAAPSLLMRRGRPAAV